MIEINLLPWRDHFRRIKRKQINLLFFLGMMLIGFLIKLFNPHHSSQHFQPPVKMISHITNTPLTSEVFSDEVKDHHELLMQVPLQQLRFVGFLSNGKNIQAFVQTKAHETGLVKVGSRVGVERAEIIFLNEQYMILKLDQQMIQRNLSDVL